MVFKKRAKGRPLLLLLSGQMCTEDAVDCACASVAHQVSVEHLRKLGTFVSKVLYRKLMRIMRTDALLTSDLVVIIWMTDLGLKKQTGLSRFND